MEQLSISFNVVRPSATTEAMPPARWPAPVLPRGSRPIARIADYPEQSRHYLQLHRLALEWFAKHGPTATVRVTWCGEPLNLERYRQAFRDMMDKRINICGRLKDHASRDDDAWLIRDRARLAAWPRKSAFGWGLESRAARKRFPEIELEMRDRMMERYA